MTNSTDKKQKKKGPIRFEAIIPTIIVLVLIYLYSWLFLDSNLRQAMQWVATHTYGAEVNIGKVKTSFWGAYFKIFKIQVTDKENPAQNIVQIEEISMQLLWDALLRAKMVVSDAKINNIQAYSSRKSPGYIVPPTAESSKALQKVEDSVLDQTKEDFNNNVVGDVANLVDGADPSAQAKAIQAELKSDQKAKELESFFADKKKEWNERLKKLPQKKEVDALVARAEKVKLNTSNPSQFARDLKEIDRIIKDGDRIVKEYEKSNKDLNSDVRKLNLSLKDLDKLAQKDLKDLQKRLNIPDINMASFSKGLFGRMFGEKVAGLKKYSSIAKEYMPPKKTEEQKQAQADERIAPRKRGQGRNISFPITTGYPLFWLQKASISSQESSSPYSGNISGKITDATSDPVFVGKPMIVKIKGDFPKQGIQGLNVLATIDSTKETSHSKIDFKVARYPLGKQKLSDSSDIQWSINSADGSTIAQAIIEGDKVSVVSKSQFTQPQHEIKAKSKTVDEIIRGVANDLKIITLNASAKGDWGNLKWSINSNLGQKLSNGFKKQVNKKIEQAKKELEEKVFGKINKQKAKLNSQLNQLKGGVNSQLQAKKQEVNQAKQKVSSKKKKQGNQLKKQGEKALKDLKKKLGF